MKDENDLNSEEVREAHKEVLEKITREVKARNEARRFELISHISDPLKRQDLILRDSANIVSDICGYVVPISNEDRLSWITDRLHRDTIFLQRVHLVTRLIAEYVQVSLEIGLQQR